MKIFLSYARHDRELAGRLAKQLEHKGYEVWDPERELLPGGEWTASLKRALADSDAMVLLLSPDSAESRWVTYELEYALSAKHLSGRLIPVLARPTKNLPWILRELQMIRGSDDVAKMSRQIADRLALQPNHDQKKSQAKAS
ncbi:MAG: toll/interleukin-1 receptor domain-containing protein [Nitrospira sp.]